MTTLIDYTQKSGVVYRYVQEISSTPDTSRKFRTRSLGSERSLSKLHEHFTRLRTRWGLMDVVLETPKLRRKTVSTRLWSSRRDTRVVLNFWR